MEEAREGEGGGGGEEDIFGGVGGGLGVVLLVGLGCDSGFGFVWRFDMVRSYCRGGVDGLAGWESLDLLLLMRF